MEQLQYAIFPDGILVNLRTEANVELDVLAKAYLARLQREFPQGKWYECEIEVGGLRSRCFVIPLSTVGKPLAEVSYVFNPDYPDPVDPCIINDHRNFNDEKLTDKLALMATHWAVVS